MLAPLALREIIFVAAETGATGGGSVGVGGVTTVSGLVIVTAASVEMEVDGTVFGCEIGTERGMGVPSVPEPEALEVELSERCLPFMPRMLPRTIPDANVGVAGPPPFAGEGEESREPED